MRLSFALAGAALFALAPPASAVTLSEVSFSPEFQQELDEEYGPREGEVLRDLVSEAVAAELERRGAAPGAASSISIDLVIIDADPNRPTMQQLAEQPGLDAFRSVSIGGAELRAVLRGAGGEVLNEITHRRYNHSLQDLVGPPTTWTEARRAIRQFAVKVADAYVAQTAR